MGAFNQIKFQKRGADIKAAAERRATRLFKQAELRSAKIEESAKENGLTMADLLAADQRHNQYSNSAYSKMGAAAAGALEEMAQAAKREQEEGRRLSIIAKHIDPENFFTLDLEDLRSLDWEERAPKI